MTPAWLTWAVYGAGGFALIGLVALVAVGLCRSAADGDEALDRYADEQLADLHHLCEKRTRRDTRNGLGGVGGGAA